MASEITSDKVMEEGESETLINAVYTGKKKMTKQNWASDVKYSHPPTSGIKIFGDGLTSVRAAHIHRRLFLPFFWEHQRVSTIDPC